MKKFVLTFILSTAVVLGYGQCTNCTTTQTYYLDLDGDGLGEDNAATNLQCCPAEISADSLYVSTPGDLCPLNKAITTVYSSLCGDTCACDKALHGCVHPLACNYESSATIDDGSCKFPDVSRCEECEGGEVKIRGGRCSCDAVNYKVYDEVGQCLLPSNSKFCTADDDNDGLCDHDTNGDGEIDDPCLLSTCNELDALGDCGGHCLRDIDNDGVCDEYGEPGCLVGPVPTTPLDACTDSTACNYLDSLAVACIFKNVCDYCGEINDTIPNSAYWLQFGYADSTGNGVCDENDIEGCIDNTACNFNSDATWGLAAEWCQQLDDCSVCGGSAYYLDATDPSLGLSDGRCTCTTWKALGRNCDGTCENDTLPNDAYWTAINVTDSISGAIGNNVCDEEEVIGCTIATACNYDVSATLLGLDACIMKDSLDVCGGTCFSDSDDDGVCDDIDPCPNNPDNTVDECGVCGGNGIPAGACNCDGDVADAMGNCGGNCAVDADGDGVCDDNGNDPCTTGNGIIDAAGVCGGDCDTDIDKDGICDDVDTCTEGTGIIDECGKCNGTGIPVGYCDCEGTKTYDAIYVCDGNCAADADGDGICDDVDDCVGIEDECGVCDGNGIPSGACDCQGNVEDVVGVCGGGCTTDVDGDGVCDDDLDGDGIPNDPCTEGTGIIDECGVCNGPGGLEGCGCEASRLGYCDCDGNVYDNCNVCGGPGRQFARNCDGTCINDSDGDGVCDEEEVLAFKPRVNRYYDVSTGFGVSDINPFNVQSSIDQLTELKSLMHQNLETGSLRGTSLNLTIEESIVDSGVWVNKEVARIAGNMSAHSLVLTDDFAALGDLTIAGSQLSDGGIQTSSLDLDNQMVVGGEGQLNNLNVAGRTNFKDSLVLRAQLAVRQGLDGTGAPNDSTLFKLQPSNGRIYSHGGMDIKGDLLATGSSRFNNLDVAEKSTLNEWRVADLLDVNASATVKGNLRVNSLFKATTNGSDNGMVLIGDSTIENTGDAFVEGSFIATGNVLVKGDLTIEGVTFSDGGVEASALTLSGDLDSVGGNTSAGQFLNLFGRTTLRNELSMGSDFHAITSVDSAFGTDTTFSVLAASGNMISTVPLRSTSVYLDDTLAVAQMLNAEALDITGPSQLNGNLETGGGTMTLQGKAVVNGPVKSVGELKSNANVAGIKVGLNTTLNEAFTTTGGLSNTASLNVDGQLIASSNHEFAGSFENTSSANTQRVLSIQIDNNLPGNANRYLSFRNSEGKEVGRIQGERVQVLNTGKFSNSTNDLTNNNDYMLDQLAFRYDMLNAEQAYTAAERAYWLAVLEVAQNVVEVIAEATSVTGCFGITLIWAVFFPIPIPFIGVCAPHADDSFKDALEGALDAANVVFAYEQWIESYAGITLSSRDQSNWINKAVLGSMRALNTDGTAADGLNNDGSSGTTANDYSSYQYGSATTAHDRVGVTYASGAGDYAEWLPKRNSKDAFEAGQVAGVFEGELSYQTDGAERLVVISSNPIVIGNVPQGSTAGYAKAAFMGQVPVRVLGPVRTGDYLVASGLGDGNARAVSPRDLTPAIMENVIGTAWEGGNSPFKNVVNCSVGLNNGEPEVVASLGKRTEAAKKEIDDAKNLLSFWYAHDAEEVSADELVAEGKIKRPIVADEETGELTFYRPGIDDVDIKPLTQKQIEHSINSFLEEVDRQRLLGYTSEATDKLERIFKNEDSRRIMVQMLEIAFDRHNTIAVQAMRDFEGREVTKVRYAPANIKHRIPDEEWSAFDEPTNSGEMNNKRMGKWYLRKAN